MSHQITLEPSHHGFSASPDQTLLDAALDAGLILPYGCRNGACGACKAKVVQGVIEQGTIQPHALSPEEQTAGVTLLCCSRARSDVVLEVPEVRSAKDIPVKKVPCRVQSMTKLAPDVMRLQLKLPASERLQFVAGQYVDIMLKDGGRRSFSLANAPHDDELLELHVRLVPGGLWTGHVFNSMKEKEILRIEGPHGSFALREDSVKPIIFLAGGTGFAPVKSMVEHAIHAGCRRPMLVYWGARDRAGLYQNEVAEAWMVTQPNIVYVPVLSDPTPADAWTGRTGLVHQVVLADLPDLSAYQVYACGAPAMIDAAKRDFFAAGLPTTEFFSDAFTFSTPGA